MINKYSSTPLYSQLKNIIIKKIEKGDYVEDSKIPSEQEFCNMYDISRPTVRQAISQLTNNGYLYKLKGKGTFVAKTKNMIDIKNYSGFTDSILDSSNPGDRNIISLDVIEGEKNTRLEKIFNLPSSFSHKTEFAEVKYLNTVADDILSLNISYLPINSFPNIIEDIKNKKASYDILKGKYPLIPIKSNSSLEVIYTNQSDAHYLQIQTGQVLIKIDNILYSKNGQIVEYIISKYRADKCMFIFERIKS
jgi:DNA-binding GntR family transcriptional regulator